MPIAHPAVRESLYATILGSSWLELGDAVRHAHRSDGLVSGRGHLQITHGHSGTARLLARCLRFPRASPSAHTRLLVKSDGVSQIWERSFDGRCLHTRQFATPDGHLAERVGVLEFWFRLEVFEGGLLFRQTGASLVCGPLRMRLPARLAPRVEATEHAAGASRVGIRIRVLSPVVGPVLTYEGVIDLEETA